MELLSLRGPVEAKAPRLTRTEALVASFAIHFLALFAALLGPAYLPEPVRAFFAPRPPVSAGAHAESGADTPLARPRPERIPLKFAYVKIPDDQAVDSNPKAPLLSDKNRRARQEKPAPPDASRFSIDPHSEGDTITRVVPDPTRPEGPEAPEPFPAGPVGPEREARPADSRAARRPGSEGPEPAGGRDEPGAADGPVARNGPPGSRPLPDPVDAASAPAGRPGTVAGAGPSTAAGGSSAAPGGEGLKQALTDLKSGEYKFTFSNPAYRRGGEYGTLSFDTQDFPWGDYARHLYVVIRNNWLARIPLAAREGIAGYVCQRFVIARSGAIVEIRAARPSSIPPFDKASADAIRASDPLPSLPEAFPNDSEGVTFCFYYNMYPGEAE